jgi:adenylate cyclase
MTAPSKNKLFQFLWVTAFALGLIALRVFDPGIYGTMRGGGFDTLQRMFPRVMAEPQPVRVVDIDEASLKVLGQWPWSRLTLAKLVEELHGLGAASVAFDIVFPEPDRLSPRRILNDANEGFKLPEGIDVSALPDSDAVFAASFAGKPVVLAFATSAGQPEPSKLTIKSGFAQVGAPAINAVAGIGRITANLPLLDAAAAGIGGINIDLAGEQGIARQIPLLWGDGTRFAPTLSVEALRVAQGVDTLIVNSSSDTENAIESVRIGDIEVPTSEAGLFYVHYRPNPKDLYVSAADVLEPAKHDALKPLIEGNIVFVGTSAVGLLDVRTTALGETVPGVSIHAQAAEQMLSGRFLSRPEWAVGLEFIAVLLSGLAIAAIGALYRPWVPLAFASAVCAAIVATTLYAFQKPGVLLDMTFPLVAVVLTYLASTVYRLAITDKDGRNMRRMFGHYVAATVLADIERNPQNLKLGGEVRDVTVMFIDIANFTPLSEKLSPTELVNTVNGLWTACSTAILNENGTIDKFIGDAIMAFWNAPVAVEHHQFRATKAALGVTKAVAAYNENPAVAALLQSRSIPPISVRVGLASGPACVGNMGSSDRFDYSVLGETVNTAARTESTCKAVAHNILLAGKLSEETQKLAILPAGFAAMKGKSQSEPIFAVIGDEAEFATIEFQALKKEHNHLAAKLAEKPSQRTLATIAQLLDEMALHHPDHANYLRGMCDRAPDYAAR